MPPSSYDTSPCECVPLLYTFHAYPRPFVVGNDLGRLEWLTMRISNLVSMLAVHLRANRCHQFAIQDTVPDYKPVKWTPWSCSCYYASLFLDPHPLCPE